METLNFSGIVSKVQKLESGLCFSLGNEHKYLIDGPKKCWSKVRLKEGNFVYGNVQHTPFDHLYLVESLTITRDAEKPVLVQMYQNPDCFDFEQSTD